jgi:hypothetical protein
MLYTSDKSIAVNEIYMYTYINMCIQTKVSFVYKIYYLQIKIQDIR